MNPSDQAEPLKAVAEFALYLRQYGYKMGIDEQRSFVRAAILCQARHWRRIGFSWRAIACQNERDWLRWDSVFDQFWFPSRIKGTVKVSGRQRASRDLRQAITELQHKLSQDGPGAQPDNSALDTALDMPMGEENSSAQTRAQGGATKTDPLHDREFAQWMPQDLSRLDQLARRIVNKLRRRMTRRWQANPRGRRLDFRRTIRRSLRTGGVPIEPVWKRRRLEQPRLFILVDVSRSMETHAQLFLRISRAFVGVADARVFVFHTRLAEITALLQADSEAVQEKINAVTAGFSGGTRIATSMADFHRVHARAQLGTGSRVWVLSDGFDADPPERLDDELSAIQRRGAAITWFHPTKNTPSSKAMQAASSRIRRFVPLSSLRDLDAAVPVLF